MSEERMSLGTRCGFAAIIGAPNAGKSTLLNRLAGQKLAIVSPKPQTTRFRVLGIVPREGAWGRSQVLLVDTPGIFSPRRMLDRAMVKAAWSGAGDADITLLLVDAEQAVDIGPGAGATTAGLNAEAIAEDTGDELVVHQRARRIAHTERDDRQVFVHSEPEHLDQGVGAPSGERPAAQLLRAAHPDWWVRATRLS
jgi:GTPase Era involved in 16S rRNA processing